MTTTLKFHTHAANHPSESSNLMQPDLSRRTALHAALAGALGASLGTLVLPTQNAHAQSTPEPDSCVSSIAELRLLAPWETGQICVHVLGYYVPGDGGEGHFYWDSANNDGDNDGTIIAPSAPSPSGTGRWRRLVVNNTYNVRHFGAKADGSDDTLAFKAAIAALVRGSVLYVPQGVYTLSAELGPFPDGVKVVGDSTGRFARDSGTWLECYQAAGDGLRLWMEVDANSTANIIVEHLGIRARNPANVTGSAIGIMGGNMFELRDVHVVGWRYGVVLDGAELVVIDRAHFGSDEWGQGYTGNDKVVFGWLKGLAEDRASR